MTLEEALRQLHAGEPVARQAALEVIRMQGPASVGPAIAPCLHDPDPALAELAEATLWQVWARSGDRQADALFADGLEAMARQDWLEAVARFGRVIEIAPTFAEAWNKRATARYLAEHYASAIADCEEVLRLNAHHFGALAGQGLCHAALGQMAEAARCFRRALAIHPRLEGVRENLARIQQELVRGNGH